MLCVELARAVRSSVREAAAVIVPAAFLGVFDENETLGVQWAEVLDEAAGGAWCAMDRSHAHTRTRVQASNRRCGSTLRACWTRSSRP